MMLAFILEAALRSLLMALAVWAAIRLLRLQAIVAQKVAWVLVLLAAGVMPLVMHTPWLAMNGAIRIPLRGVETPKLRSMLARWTGAQSATSVSAAGRVTMEMRNRSAVAWKPATPREQVAASSVTAASAQARAVSTFASERAFALRPSQSQSSASDSITSNGTSTLAGDRSILISREVDLPMAPVGVAFELPSLVARQARFWTASRLRMAALVIYLGLVCLLLLRTVAGLAIAIRVLRRAKQVHGFTDEAGRPLKVRVSRDLMTPVTIGSTVVLPADYAEWDVEKLRVVLAHEQSHVRQGDFYLQLLAAGYAAAFWFSPLGWWLKSKLSDLGEALSDHAGLEQAPDAATYAQVLLEFAAKPRPKHSLAPLAGVAMARSSRLSGRIERILNDRRFRLAFLGGRRHAMIAAALVPAALVVAVGGIRIVPAVHAQQSAAKPSPATQSFAQATTIQAATTQATTTMCKGSGGQAYTIASWSPANGKATARTIQAVSPAPGPAAAPVPAAAPNPDVAVPSVPAEVVAGPQAPDSPDAMAPDVKVRNHDHDHVHVWVDHQDDDGDSFSIVHENGDGTMHWNGEYNGELARVRKQMNLHGDYIWFQHDGKSYVITDPAILAQANQMFRPDERLEQAKAQLDEKQAELNQKMAQYSPDAAKVTLDSPEMKKQMAELNARLTELQSEKFKQLTADLNKQINQEVLAHLQEKIGEIQSQIGEVQGQIGEEMGRLGEQQGQIGEEMGRVGEQMGKIGAQEGKRAEEASRRMKSVLDQALRDGKAKPVD